MKLGPEDKLQLAVLEYLEAVVAEPYVLHHSPNGGKRSMTEGQKFKMLGTMSGWPDLILITPAQYGVKTNFIELKAGKGRPTESQQDCMSTLRTLGCGTAVCWSIDDVRNALKAWGIKTREA